MKLPDGVRRTLRIEAHSERQVIVLMQLFSQLLSATRANIDELRTAAEQVEASATLRSVLGLCLKIGNALNQGTLRKLERLHLSGNPLGDQGVAALAEKAAEAAV